MAKTESKVLPPRESISSDLHPIVTRKYTIVTPMMEATASEVVQSIERGITGIVVFGGQRIGKTRLRRFLMGVAGAHFKRLAVFGMNVPECEEVRERVFFGRLLKTFRHPLWDVGNAAQRRDRLVEAATMAARSSGRDQLVLFIDQAQRLTEIHYEWLTDIYDELDERGIELFVILVGQPELTTTCDDYCRRRKNHILGRFMVDRIHYHGIRSSRELARCLDAYDSRSKYPEGTDWTFTRYFFPEAFDKGWKLSAQARLFWNAFQEVGRHEAVLGTKELPMQFFARAIESFLRRAEQSEGLPKVDHGYLMQLVLGAVVAGAPRDELESEEEEGT